MANGCHVKLILKSMRIEKRYQVFLEDFSFWIINTIFFLFVVDFVLHWNETAMGLHVFPIPIPPPTSLSTRSL